MCAPDSSPARPAGEGPLRIEALGPLRVSRQGVDHSPSAPMACRALGVLLLHVNRATPVSSLIEELWDGRPPRLARKTVQTYIYQVRRALPLPPGETHPLTTCPNGYTLALRPGQLDVWEFELLTERARSEVRSGDPARAFGILREALALWRGPAFGDIALGPLLSARRRYLDGVRLDALELRIDVGLRLGRHRALLGELRELTDAHPLHEAFAAQLMVAAHRAGRRGIALEAYARLRRELVGGLGVEPSRRLRDLHTDVLNEASSLDDLDARGDLADHVDP